jgi:hypothetical protein
MLFPDAPVLGVVKQEIGQLASLLHKMKSARPAIRS